MAEEFLELPLPDPTTDIMTAVVRTVSAGTVVSTGPILQSVSVPSARIARSISPANWTTSCPSLQLQMQKLSDFQSIKERFLSFSRGRSAVVKPAMPKAARKSDRRPDRFKRAFVFH